MNWIGRVPGSKGSLFYEKMANILSKFSTTKNSKKIESWIWHELDTWYLMETSTNQQNNKSVKVCAQYTQSCTGTLWSRHSRLIFSGKWKTTTHITRWKCMTIQFTTWFWQHTSACMYEICLNHFIFSFHGLSVVSIDYSIFILSYRFGLAVLFLCRDHKVPVQLCAYCVPTTHLTWSIISLIWG